jgi:[acyl-carrier-protein] S-malonyltransferase
VTRALVVVPGRGSYGRDTLGILANRAPAAEAVIDACEAWRHAHGRPSLRALDAEPAFKASVHLAGEHASLLTFAASLADLAELDRARFEIVGVCGNSMGWYGALAVAGALPLDDAIALVDTMGWYQRGNVIGGQILYPLLDEAGAPDAAARRAIEAGFDAATARGGRAYLSIDLGSHAVLGADTAGLAALMEMLPPVERGARTFPARLPMHAAFHTPLLAETAAQAQVDLAGLRFSAPRVPLIDGRGVIHRPRWADPEALRAYTLGDQVVAPYDFALGLRTALQHCGPDVVILLGPGNSLGGAAARILQTEGWRGASDRAAFDAVQASDAPALLSFGVKPQRARLIPA